MACKVTWAAASISGSACGPLDLHATTLRTGSKYEVQDIQADLWPVPCIALGVQHRISEPSITCIAAITIHYSVGCSGRFHSPSAAAPLWFESVISAPLLIQLAFSRYLRAPNIISVIDLFMCARPSQLRMYLVNCCSCVHTSLAQLCGCRSAVFRSGSPLTGLDQLALTCLSLDALFISPLCCADLW